MKFDLNELKDLDLESIGSWPKHIKLIFALLLAILVFIFSYFFFITNAIDTWQREQAKELQLKNDFKSKYQLAANQPLYSAQLTVMETQFAELLQMLPSKNEMPELLDDLTYVATHSGLKMSSLNWEQEIEQDFYVEFPINMSVRGSYHQIGRMAEGIAGLPRIVSIHDFTIAKDGDSGFLKMDLLAKTYRFKESAELNQHSKVNK